MRVGIISDTHDNITATKKAISIFKKEKITTIFHLGDFVAPFTLKLFEGFELYGVFGNNDGEKILLMDVANKNGFQINDAPFELVYDSRSFLLLHGWGSVERTKKLVNSLAKSEEYDFILYGHTHHRDLQHVGRTTVINPGEACGYLTGKKTIAILNLDDYHVDFINID